MAVGLDVFDIVTAAIVLHAEGKCDASALFRRAADELELTTSLFEDKLQELRYAIANRINSKLHGQQIPSANSIRLRSIKQS